MSILDNIVSKTRLRAAVLNLKALKNQAYQLELGNFAFKNALLSNEVDNSKIKIIAEIKKASPSKGIICENFEPDEIAYEYKKAGVDCISVLSEPFFFKGKSEYVGMVKEISNKPILRKDFIIDPAQIYESKVLGADCILLICSILDSRKLNHFLEIAQSLGLNAIVECHDENEIKTALDTQAEIIGINNRDLKTFDVDINNTLKLRKLIPDNIIVISESGIKTRDEIKKLEDANVNAVLIGETFMRSNDKENELKKLKGIL